jgi:hypothetical protein
MVAIGEGRAERVRAGGERVAALEVEGIGRRAATVVEPLKRQASISAVWREERRALSWADALDVGYWAPRSFAYKSERSHE